MYAKLHRVTAKHITYRAADHTACPTGADEAILVHSGFFVSSGANILCIAIEQTDNGVTSTTNKCVQMRFTALIKPCIDPILEVYCTL